MAWQLDFQQDTSIDGVGTVTATYTPESGPTISESRRLDTNDSKDIENFVVEMRAMAEQHDEKITEKNAVIAKIENILNGV